MCIPVVEAASPVRAGGISEVILAAIWNEQAPLRGPMWDCEGTPVAVIYRGRWTAGSGPDFEGAILELGAGQITSGSVEMHLRCADWYAHGHDKDPRYNSVVLHVVLWPAGIRPVIRADGIGVPTLTLADYITAPSGELLERMSPLVPNLGALSEEPCWQRTAHWPLDKLTERIDNAAHARLIAKAAIMEADLDAFGSADEVFYRGIMDALGYSANREPMRQVATTLPLSQLLTLPLTARETERSVLLESVLLGTAGLLPSQRPDLGELDWLSSEYAEEVESIWRTHAPLLGIAPDAPPVRIWNVDRVRPANSAPRRLAAAASLLARLLWERNGMLGPFLEMAAPPEQLAKRWTELLGVPYEGYWASHADFGSALAGDARGVALVGKSRAADMVINILIPLLFACSEARGDAELGSTAMRVYECYPKLSSNRITRAMEDEALGPRRKEAINGARRQQGLIHLYKLYCEARRCYQCPLSGLGGE